MYRRRVGEEAVQGVLDGMKGGISSSGLVAGKWVDNVDEVRRICERMMLLRLD